MSRSYRPLRPRLTPKSALAGTRVYVASEESMRFREHGTIVEADAGRTAQLDDFNRLLLKDGAVLVEQANGTLFVELAEALEVAPTQHELRQIAFREALWLLSTAEIETDDLSHDEDREIERIIHEDITRLLDSLRRNEEDEAARERIAARNRVVKWMVQWFTGNDEPLATRLFDSREEAETFIAELRGRRIETVGPMKVALGPRNPPTAQGRKP